MNKIIKEDIENIVNTPGMDWERFRGKTVLVTGAYGMLASYLVYTLAYLNVRDRDFNCRLLALGRSREKMSRRFGEYLAEPWFEPVYDNVSDMRQPEGGVDFIIHAASPTDPRSYLTSPSAVISANVCATEKLLKLASEKKSLGFLYISSGEVYGVLKKPVIEEEDSGSVDIGSPRSVYALSKRLGECLCRDYARKYGVPARIVRPSHTYGPTMDPEHDGRVFADFVRDAVHGRDIVITGDGRASRAFIYLTDAALGYFRVLLEGADGEAYNVTNNDGIRSIGELAKCVASLAEPPVKAVFGTPDENYRENANKEASVRSTKKLEALHWRASVSPEEGFYRTVESFRR